MSGAEKETFANAVDAVADSMAIMTKGSGLSPGMQAAVKTPFRSRQPKPRCCFSVGASGRWSDGRQGKNLCLVSIFPLAMS